MIGVGVGFLLMLTSVAILAYNLFDLLIRFYIYFLPATPTFEVVQVPTSQPILTPLIPGANVPTEHIFYYFAGLLVAGIIHELGHAIAAIQYRKVFFFSFLHLTCFLSG